VPKRRAGSRVPPAAILENGYSTPPAGFGAPLNPLALTLPGVSQLMDFFVNAYRTPPFLLPIYLAAAQRYGVPWQVLAAINEVESDYGYDLSVSSAGAEGWMQFLPAQWLVFGVDATGAGLRDPYNPADAIFAAARYLAAAGAARDLPAALYAYNHSASYVESVMLRTRLLAGTPQSLIDGLAAIVNGRFPLVGGGARAAAPVWSAAPQAGASRSMPAGDGGRHRSALAPPPAGAGATGGLPPRPAVVGASVTASPGSAVVAVQQAEVVHRGRNTTLGRFIELRDAFGDTYTYARLGLVAERYAAASQAPGGALARRASGRGSPATGTRMVPLRPGGWVPPGTVLGRLPGAGAPAAAHFLFEIRPAGAAPIDPRPVLEAWQLMGETEGRAQQGTQPLFGPNAGDALISEIVLMSQSQLQARVLSDPRARIYACGRADIAAGRIDRRVLETLDFLLSSGLYPTVSALRCGRGSAATPATRPPHARGDAVAISAFNRVPIRGHNGRGSLGALAIRRLLALPWTVRPQQIVAPAGLRAAAGASIGRGAAARLDIAFAAAGPQPETRPLGRSHRAPSKPRTTSAKAPAGSSAASGAPQPAPELNAAQWRRLIARIAHFPEPHVAIAPTSAAVPDNSSSPPPAAAAPNFAPAPSQSRSPAGPSGGAPPPAKSSARPRVNEPVAALAAPPSASTLGALAAEPTLVLEREAGGEVNGAILREFVTLRAAGVPAQVKSIAFQRSPAEAEDWTEIKNEGTTSTHTSFNTVQTPDGLYDLRVIVIDGQGGKHEATLRDRLIANNAPPIVELAQRLGRDELVDLDRNLDGRIVLAVHVLEGVIASAGFEWKPAGARAWHTIAEAGTPPYTASFDTKLVKDGRYDFRVVPEGEDGQRYASIPVRGRLVDNTPPSVELVSPGSAVGGHQMLSALATDAGSGVASVSFERARAGSSAWRKIGEVTRPPYSHALSAESRQNGLYHLRATAIDNAGNRRTSAVIPGVAGNNPRSHAWCGRRSQAFWHPRRRHESRCRWR
jgi:hypothetical protein